MGLKALVGALPLIGPAARALYRAGGFGRGVEFRNSRQYWEDRYRRGGNSGAGSYNRLAAFKAEVVNAFVEHHGVRDVIEFGSGDGAQLRLARYPRYMGVDVSPTAVALCRDNFHQDRTKSFATPAELAPGASADLALSLDVIYHLAEDVVFERYMRDLFDSAGRFVIIYSSNEDRAWTSPHVRHRQFTRWVEARAEWRLIETIPNRYPFDPANEDQTSFADFHIFARVEQATVGSSMRAAS